jgi:hypothetical protein
MVVGGAGLAEVTDRSMVIGGAGLAEKAGRSMVIGGAGLADAGDGSTVGIGIVECLLQLLLKFYIIVGVAFELVVVIHGEWGRLVRDVLGYRESKLPGKVEL